jgi:hypothetical protein
MEDIATATATVPFDVEYDVPAMPTEESQDDKGIDHPLWSCEDCDTVWRAHERMLCPGCACQVGDHLALDEDQTGDLLYAIMALDGTVPTWDEDAWDRAEWEFRNLVREHVPWYDMNSRQNIQACYEALCARAPHSKIAFAIAFFEEDYKHAPEEDNTFCPEVPYFQVDAQYDLQRPPW